MTAAPTIEMAMGMKISVLAAVSPLGAVGQHGEAEPEDGGEAGDRDDPPEVVPEDAPQGARRSRTAGR